MRRKCTYFGNSWISMFLATNDNITIAPLDAMDKVIQCAAEHLKTDIHQISIGESNLVGIYLAMNKNGIILPNITTESEVKKFKKLGINVYHSKCKANAHGNNIAVNDKGGLINPLIPASERGRMEDALGVELVPMRLARYSTVGSSALAGNKGFLVHYAAEDDELKAVEDVLKVKGERGTVNMGVGFVSLGVLSNKHGYIVGEATSAHEMGRVESALGFIDDL
jgi:translation initiation factor 6